MKQNNREKLPLTMLVPGAAAALVRGLLYLTAVEETGLLARNHPLQWLLALLCAAAVALVLPAAKQKGSNRYADHFGPSSVAAIGSFAMAAGTVLTVLEGNPMPRPMLVLLWYASGILAAGGLVWAGLSRKAGKQPFVLCYAVLCLFLALHMVSRYQPWSGNPQIQDWLFSLVGAVGLTLCAYHQSAFSADRGKRRSFLATSLLTVFACCAALPHTEYFALYLGGGIWAFTGCCRMSALPEQEEAPTEQERRS